MRTGLDCWIEHVTPGAKSLNQGTVTMEGPCSWGEAFRGVGQRRAGTIPSLYALRPEHKGAWTRRNPCPRTKLLSQNGGMRPLKALKEAHHTAPLPWYSV
ncbi:hypothetical protein [Metallosphaera javensis (ex Sakai et al. 2022)]|uniref:hypothetical protein n=1 Tax=Metallosphaera javensis (ex Sakai et al. 2022) TaxID=2775498 RepID=UPI0025866D29